MLIKEIDISRVKTIFISGDDTEENIGKLNEYTLSHKLELTSTAYFVDGSNDYGMFKAYWLVVNDLGKKVWKQKPNL